MNIERLDFELESQTPDFAAASCHVCLCDSVNCSGAELKTPAEVLMDMHHVYEIDNMERINLDFAQHGFSHSARMIRSCSLNRRNTS